MSDESSIAEKIDSAVGSGRIEETIIVPFSADISRSQHAKILRQVANILHALLSNATRYAAIGDGRNAGASFPIHQQTYTAAANVDAAATMLENAGKAVIDPSRLPPPPGSLVGRA
jgi:hypothetical protein